MASTPSPSQPPINVATLRELAHGCGLQEVRHELSPDGGNLLMVLRAGAVPVVASPAAIPGNHARVTRVLEQHTMQRYLLDPRTALRTLRRLAGALDERLYLGLAKPSGKALLDTLYADALRMGRPPAALPALRCVTVAAAAIAGAWWLECELIDDAHQLGWSTLQGTGTYFAVQAAVLAGIWFLCKRTTRLRGHVASLGAMIAVMPILH